MAVVLTTWKPNPRKVVIQEKPDYVPEEVYTEAIGHKYNYNAMWDFWVWNVSNDYNVSMAEAEAACIRGIQKEFHKMTAVWGDKVGKWFEDFMEMGDIFRKVKHPEYVKELGYGRGYQE